MTFSLLAMVAFGHHSSQAKSCELGYHLLDLVGEKLLASMLEDPVRRREYRLRPAADTGRAAAASIQRP